MANWEEECHHGVKRKLAGQHGRCSSCQYFLLNVASFPNMCSYPWSNKLKSIFKKAMDNGLSIDMFYVPDLLGMSHEEVKRIVDEIIAENPGKYRWI